MRHLKLLISSKITFFIITSFVIFSLNLTPLIIYIRHSPPGRTFTLIHNNTQDFYFYQSLINQGANGQWLTTDPYTIEPHKPSIIFSYFLWLGKISRLLSLPHALTYHLARLIISIFLIFAIYYLLFTINIPYPQLAFFFFLFSAPFMHKIGNSGKIIDVPYMHWWTGMDPIRRVAYLPHHMFGALFLVLSIITIIKFMKSPKLSLLVWLGIFAFLLAFVHTPSLLILLITLPPTIVVYLLILKLSDFNSPTPPLKIRGGIKGGVISTFIGLLVYWVIGLLFLFIMVSQTNRGFPWSQYIDWERKLQFPLGNEIFGAFGILLPFALIGIIRALLSKRFEYLLTACWFVVPILIIPFAPKLNLSNIRLIQGVPYLPLSILAVLGVKTLQDILSLVTFSKSSKFKVQKGSRTLPKETISEIDSPQRTNDAKKMGYYAQKIRNLLGLAESEKFVSEGVAGAEALRGKWLIGLLVSIFIVFTYPTLSWSLKDQIKEYWFFWGNVYLDNRLNNAFAFINDNFPKKTITLSTFYTGNYLPAFTHTISFIGHSGYTYNVDQKQKDVARFFENKMSESEAKEFLTKNKINLVFQGPEEKPIYNKHLYPTILKPVHDKEEVTLYVLK